MAGTLARNSVFFCGMVCNWAFTQKEVQFQSPYPSVICPCWEGWRPEWFTCLPTFILIFIDHVASNVASPCISIHAFEVHVRYLNPHISFYLDQCNYHLKCTPAPGRVDALSLCFLQMLEHTAWCYVWYFNWYTMVVFGRLPRPRSFTSRGSSRSFSGQIWKLWVLNGTNLHQTDPMFQYVPIVSLSTDGHRLFQSNWRFHQSPDSTRPSSQLVAQRSAFPSTSERAKVGCASWFFGLRDPKLIQMQWRSVWQLPMVGVHFLILFVTYNYKSKIVVNVCMSYMSWRNCGKFPWSCRVVSI